MSHKQTDRQIIHAFNILLLQSQLMVLILSSTVIIKLLL